mmetsp:Transcript_24412/g.34227  ORF Transcript_24412/g.34227 Transcript_24412/m.34227 type:complete len:103 (+) Transcript_24412:126-434(+)
MASQTGAIPISKRNDGWHPNPRDLSTTPGGTIYATTPGGTKFVYNRDALLMLAKSPLSREPPNLPKIPGVTAPQEIKPIVETEKQDKKHNPSEHEEMFDMDN